MCTHIKVPLLRRCGLLYLDPSVQAWKQHHSKEKKWEWISVRPFLERWRKKNSCTTWGSRKAEQCRKTCISFTLLLWKGHWCENTTKLSFAFYFLYPDDQTSMHPVFQKFFWKGKLSLWTSIKSMKSIKILGFKRILIVPTQPTFKVLCLFPGH